MNQILYRCSRPLGFIHLLTPLYLYKSTISHLKTYRDSGSLQRHMFVSLIVKHNISSNISLRRDKYTHHGNSASTLGSTIENCLNILPISMFTHKQPLNRLSITVDILKAGLHSRHIDNFVALSGSPYSLSYEHNAITVQMMNYALLSPWITNKCF